MATEFKDLTDSEICRYCCLLNDKARAITNGLERIAQYKLDAQQRLLTLTTEQVDDMLQKMETEIRAGIEYLATREITFEMAREATKEEPTDA